MTRLRATAYAKLNLALHVRRRRDDGYHELETVFAFCDDGDTVSAEVADATTLTIDGPFAEGLSTTDNLVLAAAQAAGFVAALHLTKNLPVASGIGGGSADAAATLRLAGRPDLALARRLGADVPACVASVTARAEGVGDVFSPVTSVAGMPVLLANPRIALSTGSVFAAWDGVDRGPLGDWSNGRNDLEAPASMLVPAIAGLIAWLAARPGATFARMSGSGATCFALFVDTASRDDAVAAAVRDLPEYWTLASRLR